MYTIERVRMENFLSFRKADFSFQDHQGITLIEGPNGAGKSTIFDAVSWCLFGRFVSGKRVKANDVSYRFSEGGRTSVTCSLLLNSRRIQVIRSRTASGPALEVHGISTSKGRSAGVQDALIQALGVDWETFSASVMFGGVSKFCLMTDAERKKILEAMLHLNYFTVAQEIAKARENEVESIIADLNLRQQANSELLEDLKDRVTEVARKKESYAGECHQQLYDALHEVQVTQEDLDEAYYELGIRINQYNKLVQEFESVSEDWVGTKKVLEKAAKKQSALLEKSQDKINPLVYDEKECVKKIEELQKDKHPDFCPECGQRWPKNEDTEKHRAKAVRDLEVRLESVRSKLSGLRSKHIELEDEANKRDDALDAHLRLEPSALPTRSSYLMDQRNTVTRISYELASAVKTMEGVERSIQQDPYTDMLASLKERKAKEDAKAETLYQALVKYQKRKSYMHYWVAAFGRKGMPAYLMDSAIPQLNHSASGICRTLTDGTIRVAFDPEAVRGSQATLDVVATKTDGGESYQSMSKGERSRVDLAVLFSIRDLMSAHGNGVCKQLFIDELFDGMDDEGVESVVRVLREHYGDYQAFVISHSPAFKALADNVISVTKSRKGSDFSTR